ncbi:hypothetical protein HELRODRAFT_162636 [Helobdella robusta]|uniref:Uncharacterized protein n=1 Tax=Helobdella robusta TaxID=6412 RepID=T1ESY5_HELRO|nr:hypothetical protein HELRODRAFT_162636 [Helobdella robusta]ESN99141.1 hypothetical protein HELRODRAFT_162636 [Helobdella robusta]
MFKSNADSDSSFSKLSDAADRIRSWKNETDFALKLKKEIQKLKFQLEQEKENNSDLISRNSVNRELCYELRSMCSKINEELSHEEKILANSLLEQQMQNQKVTFENQIDEKVTTILSLRANIDELNNSLSTLQIQLHDREMLMSNLKHDVALKKDQIEGFLALCTDNDAKLLMSNEEIEKLKFEKEELINKIDLLTAEKNDMSENSNVIKKNFEESLTTLKKHNEEFVVLKKQLDDKDDCLKHVINDKLTLENQISMQNTELEIKVNALLKLENENLILTTNYDKLIGENECLNSKLKILEDDVASLNIDIVHKNEQIGILEDKLTFVDSKLTKKNTEMQILNEELHYLKNKVVDMTSNHNLEIEKFTNEFTTLKANFTSAKELSGSKLYSMLIIRNMSNNIFLLYLLELGYEEQKLLLENRHKSEIAGLFSKINDLEKTRKEQISTIYFYMNKCKADLASSLEKENQYKIKIECLSKEVKQLKAEVSSTPKTAPSTPRPQSSTLRTPTVEIMSATESKVNNPNDIGVKNDFLSWIE